MTKYEMIFVTGYKIAISPHSPPPHGRSANNTFPSTGLMTGPSKFWFELNQVVVYGLKHLILFFWHNIIMSWASFVPVFPLCSVETMIEMDDRSGHGRCHGCHVSSPIIRCHGCQVSYPPHHIRNQSGDNVEILALMSWDKTERPTSDSDHDHGLTFHLHTIAAILLIYILILLILSNISD